MVLTMMMKTKMIIKKVRVKSIMDKDYLSGTTKMIVTK